MNQQHAVLLQEGGKCRVLSWAPSELDESRSVPVLQSFEDFRNRYSNRRVPVGVDKRGLPVTSPLGDWWLKHEQRRQYKQFRFLPGQGEEVDGYLNLWRGWGVEPAPGDWSLMQSHIRDVIAGGDAVARDYIIRWLAWAVQNPASPAEVALVFRGGRGSGKGTFIRAFKDLFGQHGTHITSSDRLTGNFNSHLRDVVVLFADEAVAPRDKKAEGILKGLITEPELAVERKGIDVTWAKNHLHIIMASNEDWVVPAGLDERRFAVFDVSNARAQEYPYFAAIVDQMSCGGAAAMLYDLMHLDLGNWHPRKNVPQTDALRAQKANSLSGFDAVFLDLLRVGHLPAEHRHPDGSVFVATTALRDYAAAQSRREDVSLNDVSKLLKGLRFEKRDQGRPRGFVLPPLPKARAAWDAARSAMAWDETAEWDVGGARPAF